MKPSVLFSTSYNPIVPNSESTYNGVPLQHIVRPVDFKVNKSAKLRLLVKSVIDTHNVAVRQHCSHVVLCNCGFEVPLTCLLTRMLRPRYKCVVFDYIMSPSNSFDKIVSKVIRQVSTIIVIRRGDENPLLERFGVPKSNISFVKLPIFGDLPEHEAVSEPFVYSGGTARRDWLTLCTSLSGLSIAAKVVTDTRLSTICDRLPENIEELGFLSPSDARKVMVRSMMVCLSFQDTVLPSGPLVLLDAMASGKPIIATHCNGTRDYITHNHNGLLFPPKDHDALRSHIIDLVDNMPLRKLIGSNARQTIIDEHLPKHFHKNLFKILNIE